MSFPLFRRPGSVVVVDDDEMFVNLLAHVLSPQWKVFGFGDPRVALATVREDAARRELDVSHHQSIVSNAGEIPVVGQLLKYLEVTPDRFAFIHTVIGDYSMPAMNGLDMFRRFGAWEGSRVLLTGAADDRIAIEALNAYPARLIDQYVSKTDGVTVVLPKMVNDLSVKSHPRYSQIWRNLLSDDQFKLLQDRDVAEDLTAFARRHWAEYVVVGRPFGILGVTPTGQPQWLQLEPISSLALAADIAADSGCCPEEIQQVAAGKALTAVELVGLGEVRLRPATALNNGKLLGAIFEPWPALAAGGYTGWLGSPDSQ